jgi:hypothetical protein
MVRQFARDSSVVRRSILGRTGSAATAPSVGKKWQYIRVLRTRKSHFAKKIVVATVLIQDKGGKKNKK